MTVSADAFPETMPGRYEWAFHASNFSHVLSIIGRTKADQYGLFLLGNVLFGYLVLLAAIPNHGSQDADALQLLDDLAAKLVSPIHPSDAGGVGLLSRDFENVPKSVAMETGHCGEVCRESFTVARAASAGCGKVTTGQPKAGGSEYLELHGALCCRYRTQRI
jgi:hypothetical protein